MTAELSVKKDFLYILFFKSIRMINLLLFFLRLRVTQKALQLPSFFSYGRTDESCMLNFLHFLI